MSDKMIVEGSKFDAKADVVFTKPKVNSSGSKNVGILNSKTKKSLYLSTPLMLTWGINENDFDGSGRKTYDLSLLLLPFSNHPVAHIPQGDIDSFSCICSLRFFSHPWSTN